MMNPLLTVAIAFVASALAVVLLDPVCVRLGHVDKPGGRKRHGLETPLSGGLAIATSLVLLGMLMFPSREFAGFAVGMVVLLILGAMDDRKHVPALWRLVLQTLAVSVGVYLIAGVRLDSLGALTGGGDVLLGPFSLAFTVFAAVGVINAVNMIDGMDGLAGGFSALLIGVILLLASGTSAVNIALLCLTIGSLFGFLLFNLRMPWQRRARIFLGDAGSLVLGYILVWFAIQGSQGESRVFAPITAVWLFGLPLMDTVYLMGSRVLRGQSPLAADRYHFHHLLQRVGLSPGWALYAWLLVAAAFMGAGVGMEYAGVSEAVSALTFLIAFAGYCAFSNLAWRRLANRRRVRRVRQMMQ